MGLLSTTVSATVLDSGGQSSVIRCNIPSSVAEAAAVGFSEDFMALCQVVMSGGIQEVGVTLSVDLSATGIKTVAAVLADTAEKFFNTFRSALGNAAKIFLPTIDETLLLESGAPDPAATDVTDWMTANLSGLELTGSVIVSPCDKYGSDLTTLTGAKELFKKRGRPRQ